MQKRMNAEAILAQLAKMRERLPVPQRPRPRAPEKTSRVDARSVEDFEAEAVVEALESLAEDIRAIVDEKREKAFEMALDIYYKTEELSRDPENANLLEHVEKMQEAYERSYGHKIPTREETEARRRLKKGE